MTGYGEAVVDNIHIELKTFNHRFWDVNINIPSTLASYEFKIRTLLKNRIERGSTVFKLSLCPPRFKLDVTGAKEHYSFLKKLNKILGANLNTSFDTFLEFKNEIPPNWKSVEKALNLALEQLIKTRIKEGEKIEKDIRTHLRQSKKLFINVKQKTPKLEERKIQFKQKLAEFTERIPDERKLMDEFAFILMKEDLNEEQNRFETHLNAFEKNINGKKTAGKYLVFLIQEMCREINTISSKVKSPAVSQLSVKLKNELEKIREQVENVK